MADGEEAVPVNVNDEQVAQITVLELKAELRRRRLRVSGRKRELVTRLRAALVLKREHGARNEDEDENNDDVEEEDDDEDIDDDGVGNEDDGACVNDDNDVEDDDDDEEEARATPVISNRQRRTPPRVLLTIRDVEESLKKFSGDDHLGIQRWLEDFEEMAEMCEWSDVQKVAYAKRLLKGSAKLFVSYERCAKTWTKLKRALKEEFDEVVDSYHIHRVLTKRKKKTDETHHEYIYKMLEIAAHSNVETRAVIQYIIEGIPDDASNKAILYGAKKIRQLKERFTKYESMKNEMKSKSKTTERKDDKTERNDGTDAKKKTTNGAASTKAKRCYNCVYEVRVVVSH